MPSNLLDVKMDSVFQELLNAQQVQLLFVVKTSKDAKMGIAEKVAHNLMDVQHQDHFSVRMDFVELIFQIVLRSLIVHMKNVSFLYIYLHQLTLILAFRCIDYQCKASMT